MNRAATKNKWMIGVNITNIISKIRLKHKTNKFCNKSQNKK